MKRYDYNGLLILIVALVLVLVLFACDDKSTRSKGDTGVVTVIHDPWPDENAELLALWASDEVCAPEQLYDIIHNDLELISSQWCDSLPFLCTDNDITSWDNCDVKPLMCDKMSAEQVWLSTHTMSIGVDNNTFEEMKAGTYTAWDDLNEFYHIDTITFSSFLCFVKLEFLPHLSMVLVAEEYRSLPGVIYATPSGCPGDASLLTLEIDKSIRNYIYRVAWGDCPAGCAYSHYWKIQIRGRVAVILDEWGYEVPDGRPA